MILSGVVSCCDRDGHRAASAIAWYGGENDDRLAWLSDSCSNTSEGGAGWTAVAEKGGPLPIKYYYERDTGIKDQNVHMNYTFTNA